MDPAGHSSFSGKATDSDGSVAAAEGMGLPLPAVDVVKNNGTKADHDNKNSDRKSQGDKQNHCGHQEESVSAGNTKDSHRVIINEIEHLPVYMAILKGDLNEIRNRDPEALSTPITEKLETPLHVAIQASRPVEFIRLLVDKLPAESLLQKNRFGYTALHEAAVAGNAKAARIMVDKNSELPQIKNEYGNTPLHRAAVYGHEEVVCFLLSVTRAPSPFDGLAEARLLNSLISAGFYGYAFDVIKDHPETERYYVPPPKSADGKEKDGKQTTGEGKYVEPTPFTILARKPEAFERKGQLGFCQRILHDVFLGNSAHKDADAPEIGDEENQVKSSETRESEQSTYWKGTYSQHLKKKIRAVDLLKLLIEEVMKHPSDAKALLAPPLETAARLGNHVFIKKIIQAYPCLVLYHNEHWHNIFHISVIHRQEDVFSLLFRMHSLKHLAVGLRDRNDNNMLHLAGMYKRSSKISGAVLKMQRELQWFKEVEKIVPPIFKEAKNHEGKTPREVFTKEHEDLVKQGEKWMKNAASSCSVVAALPITVMFAAAFKVLDCKNDTEAPLLMNNTQFLTFLVSVILGICSSSISLLMFLGMLTNRYAEDDFLEKLPRKLVVGLVTSFVSLAAMLVTFSASIHILLFHRISWMWIPGALLVLIPVIMFGFMQSRLIYETVKHTYATTIFHKKPKKRIF